jgi:hypothetical protein
MSVFKKQGLCRIDYHVRIIAGEQAEGWRY